MELVIEAVVDLSSVGCLSCDYFCIECEQKG